MILRNKKLHSNRLNNRKWEYLLIDYMPIYTRCKTKMNRTSGGPPVSIDGGGKRQEAALRCRFSATPDYSFSWGAVQSNGATVECKQKTSVRQWKTMHQQIKYKDISLHCPSLQIAFCLVFLQAEPKQGHRLFSRVSGFFFWAQHNL